MTDALAVLQDLQKMKPKVLTQAETDILSGKPSSIERLASGTV
jgi:hypothetical protein